MNFLQDVIHYSSKEPKGLLLSSKDDQKGPGLFLSQKLLSFNCSSFLFLLSHQSHFQKILFSLNSFPALPKIFGCLEEKNLEA